VPVPIRSFVLLKESCSGIRNGIFIDCQDKLTYKNRECAGRKKPDHSSRLTGIDRDPMTGHRMGSRLKAWDDERSPVGGRKYYVYPSLWQVKPRARASDAGMSGRGIGVRTLGKSPPRVRIFLWKEADQ
jgi:hypothetical protein